MRPDTRYARSGGTHIAFQVTGSGPIDLVVVPGWVSNIDALWEHPASSRFLGRLASFSRLILFDKRGTGLSDRVNDADLPTLEQRMDDVRAVMDAAGSERAAVFGYSEGGPMSVLFAATHGDRTIALICYGTYAKREWSPDYPWAPTREARQRWLGMLESEWGGVTDLAEMAPSAADDPEFRAWWSAYQRRSASPSAAIALGRMNTKIDVRDVLPAVRVPTLILHRTGDRDAHVEEGRFIAGRIPGARFIELPGADHIPWVGDIDSIVDPIQEFLTGGRPAPSVDRVLTTVLLVDLVESTRHAARLGDHAWRGLLDSFQQTAHREIDRFHGSRIKSTGDGVLATFDGPARATRCACAIRDAAHALGLETRSGVHTGEIERTGDDIAGIAVHVAARVMAEASPGQVWTTSTVRDLVYGSGIVFEDRGSFQLKGISRDWQLCRVETP
jgi:class 3 adenylate cyclase/pimeloyl-ACP methyl ester carboxylesterase